MTQLYTDTFFGCSSLQSVWFYCEEFPDVDRGQVFDFDVHWTRFFGLFSRVPEELVFYFPFPQERSFWRGVRVDEFYEESEDTSSDLTEEDSVLSSLSLWIIVGSAATVLLGGATVLCLLLRKKEVKCYEKNIYYP